MLQEIHRKQMTDSFVIKPNNTQIVLSNYTIDVGNEFFILVPP